MAAAGADIAEPIFFCKNNKPIQVLDGLVV
jgi:hypothetical protein